MSKVISDDETEYSTDRAGFRLRARSATYRCRHTVDTNPHDGGERQERRDRGAGRVSNNLTGSWEGCLVGRAGSG
jgi:hypothetical protein